MKIFVLLPRFPFPLEKGDKLRAFNQIKYLSEKHEIHLCAINDTKLRDSDLQALNPYCASIHVVNINRFQILISILRAFFNGNPLQVGYFFNPGAKKTIRRLLNEIQPDHVYCQLIRVAEYVKDQPIGKTLDFQDVFSKGIERRCQTAPFFLKPILRFEYKRLIRYERNIFDYFDNKTIISIPDRDLIPHPDREKIHVIINGVDTDFFTPMDRPKEYDIVFTGNMGYPPNVNAAEYLAREILPLVREKRPDTRVLLAGATPHTNVQALKNDHVTVTGWVEDIRECYSKARLFIAPMRIGTGLQNKLLEAMSMKIPSITSPLANQALNAVEGEEILVGKDAPEFARLILEVLDNKDLSEKMAENAYQFIQRNYNWAAATSKLERIMENT